MSLSRESLRGYILEEVLAYLIRNTGELFVGMGRGPYMLVLKAQNRDRFVQYAAQHPTHNVGIHWSEDVDGGRTWWIEPAHDHGTYQLTFRIPEALADTIFSAANVTRTALDMKRRYMSEIMIYRHEEHRDSLIRLVFDPNSIEMRHRRTRRIMDA